MIRSKSKTVDEYTCSYCGEFFPYDGLSDNEKEALEHDALHKKIERLMLGSPITYEYIEESYDHGHVSTFVAHKTGKLVSRDINGLSVLIETDNGERVKIMADYIL